MEFIYEDISSWAEPTDAELAAFLKSTGRSISSTRSSRSARCYISADRRGKSAETDARQALAQLAAGPTRTRSATRRCCAPEVPAPPLWEIGHQFGDEFAQGLLALKPGTWAGPIRSGFGLHLVHVSERRDGRLPELDEVREAVKRDWMVEKQKELKDAA